MGKGDKRTRRGKIYNGSHGKVRPQTVHQKASDKTEAKDTTRRKPARRK